MNMTIARALSITLLVSLLLVHKVISLDYGEALTKSILFYEAQRSGKLPPTQRVDWRGDSGLKDGSDAGVDLVGGYYDAGDNVKFSFPMAYTTTMLGWSVVEFEDKLKAKNELDNALDAVRWGTDYIIKAHTEPEVFYGEVGDGKSDHKCWQRPEDMTTPRTSYKIDAEHPGSDLAGENAAALAAASIAFSKSDAQYSSQLLTHAKQFFDFAKNHQGVYSNTISVANGFYSSSGFEDELLWAASWLYRATGDQTYLDYINSSGGSGGVRTMFSWDDKYVGVQTMVAKMIFDGKVDGSGKWADFKSQGEEFICNCIQKGNNNVKRSPGGMAFFDGWANLQYVASSSFIAGVYSKYLTEKQATIQCQGGAVKPEDLVAFAQSQADYILGSNPKSMSYMVGFGSSFPQQVHHRGASIISIKKDPTPVGCQEGFDAWFNKNAPNPNVLEGALVGGPSDNDEYSDARSNFNQAEPATATNAPFVGVLALLS